MTRPARGASPKVLYISTDGLRPDAIDPVRTPNLHEVTKRGAATMLARSVMPSISLPCHMSIFHSVPPERHGVLVNTFTPMARPVTGLIDRLSAAGKCCASFYSWEPLRDLSRPGHLKMSAFIAYQGNPHEADELVVETALPHLRSGLHDFVFLYLATIDEVGHDHGWMSERYLEQVTQVDRLVGEVMANVSEETTLIIHSDHGGHDRNHGTDSREDMTVPWLAMGPGISRGFVIDGPVSLLDTAPTIAHILGVQPDPAWEGRVVDEIFADRRSRSLGR